MKSFLVFGVIFTVALTAIHPVVRVGFALKAGVERNVVQPIQVANIR